MCYLSNRITDICIYINSNKKHVNGFYKWFDFDLLELHFSQKDADLAHWSFERCVYSSTCLSFQIFLVQKYLSLKYNTIQN